MTALAKTMAAVAVAGTLAGGAAMAQTIEVTPDTQFTDQEVQSLSTLFELEACGQNAAMGVQLGAMMGQFTTQEEAQAAFESALEECEVQVGMSAEQAESLVGELVEKYGEQNLNQVLENSVPKFEALQP